MCWKCGTNCAQQDSGNLQVCGAVRHLLRCAVLGGGSNNSARDASRNNTFLCKAESAISQNPGTFHVVEEHGVTEPTALHHVWSICRDRGAHSLVDSFSSTFRKNGSVSSVCQCHCLIICLHFLYMLFINHAVAHLFSYCIHLPYFWHSAILTPADRPYAHILTPLPECVSPITILVCIQYIY